LAVFAKMNNKICFLPHYATSKEIETIEKEIKVKIIKTEQAIGNLVELNDNGAVISKTANKNVVDEIKKELKVEITNVGRTDAVGSALVATNYGFAVSHHALKEEIALIQKALGVEGGSSTANTGDSLIRNSILANKKGFVAGEKTTGFELNRIDEALEQKE
jgi:translation initiation factor 6